MFNPGFSANHMMTLVLNIIKKISKFRDILRIYVENGDVFSLDEASINATMDVIGRVAL